MKDNPSNEQSDIETLEDIFRNYSKEGIIDFSLRCTVSGNNTTFYIHPQYHPGKTFDFKIIKDKLINLKSA